MNGVLVTLRYSNITTVRTMPSVPRVGEDILLSGSKALYVSRVIWDIQSGTVTVLLAE